MLSGRERESENVATVRWLARCRRSQMLIWLAKAKTDRLLLFLPLSLPKVAKLVNVEGPSGQRLRSVKKISYMHGDRAESLTPVLPRIA